MKVLSFFLILITSNCFLIYEKVPLNRYIGRIREELKEIFALRSLENIVFNDYTYTEDDISYTLSQVKPKSVHTNLYMPSATVSTSSGVSITLSWKTEVAAISPYHLIYTADLESNNEKYQIQFEVEAAEFNFKKSWEYYESDKFYIPKGEISNRYASFKAQCVDSNCPFTKDIIFSVINTFLSYNQYNMNEVFTKGVESYYKSLPFEEYGQKIYTRTSSSISNENNLDLSIETAPEYNNEIFIFKRKGTLNGQEIQEGSAIDTSTTTQSFNLNYKIYQKLIQDNQFDIKYEAMNNPASKYELTIPYLKKVINLNTSYEDNTELKLEAIMKNIEFNTYNPLKGVVTFDISVISREDLSIAFAFTLKLDFNFDINLFQNGLNFVLIAKNLVINNVSSDYDIIDMDLLKEWIENTYLCALGNNEFTLMTLAMDLSHYFKGSALKWEIVGNYLSVIKN